CAWSLMNLFAGRRRDVPGQHPVTCSLPDRRVEVGWGIVSVMMGAMVVG
ncbi:MAG: hypothetical protein JWR37_4547, partial [Mycobacterium sp.]|nr:hypothetical protein [Mycobacterium sp.]